MGLVLWFVYYFNAHNYRTHTDFSEDSSKIYLKWIGNSAKINLHRISSQISINKINFFHSNPTEAINFVRVSKMRINRANIEGVDMGRRVVVGVQMWGWPSELSDIYMQIYGGFHWVQRKCNELELRTFSNSMICRSWIMISRGGREEKGRRHQRQIMLMVFKWPRGNDSTFRRQWSSDW